MNSGQSAGINSYDCQAVIINIFIIDNKLSMLLPQHPDEPEPK